MKEKDRISPYRQTEHGKAREIDFVEGKMVYQTDSLAAARRRNRERVDADHLIRKENPFDVYVKKWMETFGR